MSLSETISSIKKDTQKITYNPILEKFSIEFCKILESKAQHDIFYKEKMNTILKLLKDLDVQHEDKYKAAFDEYNEAYNFCLLEKKLSHNSNIERVPESRTEKRPDFKVIIDNEDYYIEMKTLGFSEGNILYNQAQQDSLESKISIEEQLDSGKKIASAEIAISPLGGDSSSVIHSIESIIKRINNLIKKEQFQLGKTILLIDLKLLPFEDAKKDSLPIYQEAMYNSMVSGILWNVAFGKQGDNIYKTIEFEGKNNIEGELSEKGILLSHHYIQAISFRVYKPFGEQNQLVSFYTQNNEDTIRNLLYKISTFINDDKNSNAWEVLQS